MFILIFAVFRLLEYFKPLFHSNATNDKRGDWHCLGGGAIIYAICYISISFIYILHRNKPVSDDTTTDSTQTPNSYISTDDTQQGAGTLPSRGWMHRFFARHPELTLRVPSLIDPGRASMSKGYVLEDMYNTLHSLLSENNIFDVPCRIYNIDESWINPNTAKQRKVVVPKDNPMPYKIFGGAEPHTTLTFCICADGTWVPPMITFKDNIPGDVELVNDGPQHALYTSSSSGHTDSELYFRYIQHIEKHLNRDRPVVILQDNLGSHENMALIEFCISHGIHLFNFPKKTTHLVQPLDKLFGHFKTRFEQKREEAVYMQGRSLSRSKIPAVVRFTMDSFGPHFIKGTFAKTGLCPFNRKAIARELLVGVRPTKSTATTTANRDDDVPEIDMRVCDVMNIIGASSSTHLSQKFEIDLV